jgi:hypothetical protein
MTKSQNDYHEAKYMHHDGWKALRRVEKEGCAGSPESRDNLMHRGLIEWVPGASILRLTVLGVRALRRSRNC